MSKFGRSTTHSKGENGNKDGRRDIIYRDRDERSQGDQDMRIDIERMIAK